jgi:hypothetical protein
MTPLELLKFFQIKLESASFILDIVSTVLPNLLALLNVKFLVIVLVLYAVLYAVLYLINAEDTSLVLMKSGEIPYLLLPIFLLIIFISALINHAPCDRGRTQWFSCY